MIKDKYYARRSHLRGLVREWRLRSRTIACASSADMMAVLRELYDRYLDDHDQATLNMINRYLSKVSDRLKNERELLIAKSKSPEAKKRSREIFNGLTYNENPFLKMLPKNTDIGSYYPVPLIYNE